MQTFLISQLQQTIPRTNGQGGRGSEGGAVGVQSNFRKACLSAGDVERSHAEETEGDIEKYDILSGPHGCKDHDGEARPLPDAFPAH